MAYLDSTRCPSDETIACLLDHRLDDDTRNAVLAHAADCAACRFVLAEAARFSNRQPVRRPVAKPLAALALAASLAVAAGVGWRVTMERRPSVEDVLAAAGPHRPSPSRLSRARYQPPPPIFRDADDRGLSSPSRWDLAAEARAALAAVERRRSPDALRALGVAHLALGNHDEAIALFEDLARSESAVGNQVDLAAALLARALQANRPVDAERALGLLDTALGRAPADPAALFNRALALEQIAAPTRAARAWEDYLAIDAEGGWADEARAHLERLRQLPIAHAPGRGAPVKAPRSTVT